MKFLSALSSSVVALGLAAFVACDSSSSEPEDSSSASKDRSSSSTGSDAGEYDCTASGVKVLYPAGGESFKMGDTITVVYGSDVLGSGFRFVFKQNVDDAGMDMLEESAGPEEPDGKSCYEQKVVLDEEYATVSDEAIIRVIPYEKTGKAANSGAFKVSK